MDSSDVNEEGLGRAGPFLRPEFSGLGQNLG